MVGLMNYCISISTCGVFFIYLYFLQFWFVCLFSV